MRRGRSHAPTAAAPCGVCRTARNGSQSGTTLRCKVKVLTLAAGSAEVPAKPDASRLLSRPSTNSRNLSRASVPAAQQVAVTRQSHGVRPSPDARRAAGQAKWRLSQMAEAKIT
eukprot:9453731-Heterocapsa_arctica.AAC.1